MPWEEEEAPASGTCAMNSSWSEGLRTMRASSTSWTSGWEGGREAEREGTCFWTRFEFEITSVILRFKEQFAIPHPTKDYEEILSSVPEEYVGPVSRVMPIVQVMGAGATLAGQRGGGGPIGGRG